MARYNTDERNLWVESISCFEWLWCVNRRTDANPVESIADESRCLWEAVIFWENKLCLWALGFDLAMISEFGHSRTKRKKGRHRREKANVGSPVFNSYLVGDSAISVGTSVRPQETLKIPIKSSVKNPWTGFFLDFYTRPVTNFFTRLFTFPPDGYRSGIFCSMIDFSFSSKIACEKLEIPICMQEWPNKVLVNLVFR